MIEKEINVNVKLRLKGPAEEMDKETASVLLSVQRAVMDHWFHVGLTSDDSNVCIEQTPLVQLQRACPAKLTEVLIELVETINATGGVTTDGCPVGDPDWVDLGAVYAKACAVLVTKPVVVEPMEAVEVPKQFINKYKCDCGHEWESEWSCACDDDCPKCGTTMTPLEPEDD